MIQVKINKFTYEVKFEGDGDNVYLKEDSNGRMIFGLCQYGKNIIHIHKDLPIDRMRHTLIHELTHAYIEAYGLYHTSCENDEGVCDFMGAYGRDIIKEADRILKEYLNVDED